MQAQSTGVPSFNAPYRAFQQHEFGGTLGFPENAVSVEGQYRFGTGRFDVGLRGGILDIDGGDTGVILGAIFRERVIQHDQQMPFDGSVVAGVGLQLISNANRVIIPGGLSLGRRFDLEDSPVSIVPYLQPTAFLVDGENTDLDLLVSLGLGVDVRLSQTLDGRLSLGVGDIEGVALSLVWVR